MSQLFFGDGDKEISWMFRSVEGFVSFGLKVSSSVGQSQGSQDGLDNEMV